LTVKALTFDTGGTILDWHRGISGAFASPMSVVIRSAAPPSVGVR